MTTTLSANAQYMQVSTRVEENARNAPSFLEQQVRVVSANNRQRDGEASIRSPEEQDRSRHRLAHRGGLELRTGTGLYSACRSTPGLHNTARNAWYCVLYVFLLYYVLIQVTHRPVRPCTYATRGASGCHFQGGEADCPTHAGRAAGRPIRGTVQRVNKLGVA